MPARSVVRTKCCAGRFGMFVGCSHYPECDYTETIDKPDETAIAARSAPAAAGAAPFTLWQNLPRLRSLSRLPVRDQRHAAGRCLPHCQFPLLIEKKTAQGMKRFCASKRCGKPIAQMKSDHEPEPACTRKPRLCIEQLQQQQVIAYPTEAVFGLGCDPDSESAVMALLALKQRPVEKRSDSDRR